MNRSGVHENLTKMGKENWQWRTTFKIKTVRGIGHLKKQGTLIERKTGHLLNDLPMYLRAFDRECRKIPDSVIVIVLDNDRRNPDEFQMQLDNMAKENMILTDHVFCIAVKEMEAWLLGDLAAVEKAYSNIRKSAGKDYIQDGICDTWETLADMVYPGGIRKLTKKSVNSYNEIGRAKSEWAEKIGEMLDLSRNQSPSFQKFIYELSNRIEAA